MGCYDHTCCTNIYTFVFDLISLAPELCISLNHDSSHLDLEKCENQGEREVATKNKYFFIVVFTKYVTGKKRRGNINLFTTIVFKLFFLVSKVTANWPLLILKVQLGCKIAFGSHYVKKTVHCFGNNFAEFEFDQKTGEILRARVTWCKIKITITVNDLM